MYEGQWEIATAGYDLVASPCNQEIEPKFFADLLLSERIQTYFGNLRHRSAQPHLNADQVKNTTVVKPSLPEQKEIAHILKSCDTKIQALETEISLTDELFHATLEELMTGKLSTKNLIAQ
jgi:type I restriction enzyme S subunit